MSDMHISKNLYLSPHLLEVWHSHLIGAVWLVGQGPDHCRGPVLVPLDQLVHHLQVCTRVWLAMGGGGREREGGGGEGRGREGEGEGGEGGEGGGGKGRGREGKRDGEGGDASPASGVPESGWQSFPPC